MEITRIVRFRRVSNRKNTECVAVEEVKEPDCEKKEESTKMSSSSGCSSSETPGTSNSGEMRRETNDDDDNLALLLETEHGNGTVFGPVNPMMTNVILETFFDVCHAKDISNFRLVSKSWHETSLKAWRSTAVVILPGDDVHEDQPPTTPKVSTRSARTEAREASRTEAGEGSQKKEADDEGSRKEVDDGSRTEAGEGSRKEADEGSRTEAGEGSRKEADERDEGSRTEAGEGSRKEADEGSRTDAGEASRPEAGEGSRIDVANNNDNDEDDEIGDDVIPVWESEGIPAPDPKPSTSKPVTPPPPPPAPSRLERFLSVATDDEDTQGYQLVAKPFSNYRLDSWPLVKSEIPKTTRERSSSDLAPPTLTIHHLTFWGVCGGWIKALHLEHCAYITFKGFRDVLFRMAPNMEELKISQVDYRFQQDYHREFPPIFDKHPNPHLAPFGETAPHTSLKSLQIHNSHRSWPIKWRDMFKGYPKLESLLLCSFASYSVVVIMEGMSSVCKEKKIALKHLDILFLLESCQQMATHLRDTHLSLETLKLEIGRDVGEPLANELLRQSSSTLRTLHLIRTHYYKVAALQQPPFQDFLGESFLHLKDLRVNGPIVPNFSFLEHTPNLETLHIDFFTEEELKNLYNSKTKYARESNVLVAPLSDTFQPEFGRRMDKLTEFMTERLIDGYDTFYSLTEWMPHLVRLSAPLTDTTFPIVCTAYCGTLRELHITKEGSIGDDITGFRTIRSEGEFNPHRPPNITDLKELEKFTQDKGNCHFTDHAVWYGFACLPKLKTLRIMVTKELPPTLWAILKKKKIDVSLIPTVPPEEKPKTDKEKLAEIGVKLIDD